MIGRLIQLTTSANRPNLPTQPHPRVRECWVVMLDTEAVAAYTQRDSAIAEVHKLRKQHPQMQSYATQIVLVDEPL